MESNDKQHEADAQGDHGDGIIPPIIIEEGSGYSSLENHSVIFHKNRDNDKEPELTLSLDTMPSAPPPYSTNDPMDDTVENTPIIPKTIPQRVLAFIIMCLTNITLEPGEFMFSLGGGIFYTSYGQFTLDKSCHDRGYNSTVCDNITADIYKDIYDEINHDVIIQNLNFCAE